MQKKVEEFEQQVRKEQKYEDEKDSEDMDAEENLSCPEVTKKENSTSVKKQKGLKATQGDGDLKVKRGKVRYQELLVLLRFSFGYHTSGFEIFGAWKQH